MEKGINEQPLIIKNLLNDEITDIQNIAGDFGAEYSFDFPLTVGLDWRPGFEVTEGFAFKSSNWGIFARFRFGEGMKFVKAN